MDYFWILFEEKWREKQEGITLTVQLSRRIPKIRKGNVHHLEEKFLNLDY